MSIWSICLGQKINVNVKKTAIEGGIHLKKLVSQEIFANIGLRKKSVLKLTEFWIWKSIENIEI